jgi:outer membrane immunogenic protein
MLSKSLLAAVGIAALSTSALAADLPPRVAPPVYIPPPAFTWAGVYLGVTAGYAEGFHTFNDLNGTFDGTPAWRTAKAAALPGAARLASTSRREAWFTVSRPT